MMHNYTQTVNFGAIDLHCDTVSRLYRFGDSKRLAESDLQVDLQKMRKAGSTAQFFAVFMPVEKTESPLKTGMEMIDRFYREININSDKIAFAGSSADLERNAANGKISAFLTLEDSGIIEGNTALLRLMYRLGVRLVTLTWNYKNTVGSPNINAAESKEGLTEQGIQFIHEMQRLGMLIDVSHLSDAGFYDVCREISGPFVASHSSARSVTAHPRNLTDDMIREVAGHGGTIGVNFYSLFAAPYENEDIYAEREKNKAEISHIVRHIRHLADIGGIECVSLGSDYDGIDSAPEGLEDISRLPALFDALGKAGFNEDDIDKIRCLNALRVIREVLG